MQIPGLPETAYSAYVNENLIFRKPLLLSDSKKSCRRNIYY